MFIEPMPGIKGLNGIDGSKNDFFKTETKTSNGVSFKDIFQDAINDVKQTDQELAHTQYLFTTGQLEDPHTLTIASAKAQSSVDLLVNLRNRAVDAYNEIMRMTI